MRILLFFVLSAFVYVVRDYSWALTLISLAAVYSLVTGAQKLIYNPKRK